MAVAQPFSDERRQAALDPLPPLAACVLSSIGQRVGKAKPVLVERKLEAVFVARPLSESAVGG
jgi:hypothetical protein